MSSENKPEEPLTGMNDSALGGIPDGIPDD